MQDRIQKRIEQLEQEKEELKFAAILRDKEIDGQIQALKDVLMAMMNERPEQELQHVG